MNKKLQKGVVLIALLLFFSAFTVNAQDFNSKKKGKVHTDRSWSQLMNDQTVNFYDVQATFNDWYEKTKPEHGIKPYKRWEAFMAPRVYPHGDRTKITNPNEELQVFKNKYSDNKSTNGNWAFLGPTMIDGEIQNGSYMSPGGNGRLNAIAFDPGYGTTNEIIWVGTPAGGLWKTENDGKTWTSGGHLAIGVSEIIIDPANSQNMWIGTGDNDAGDTYSSGILKSTDGGNTWNTTSFTVVPTNYYRVKRLLADPSDINIQVAFCNGITWRTTNGWTTKSEVTDLSSFVIDDAEYKPGTNGATIYMSRENGGEAELWQSTNHGSTFAKIGSTSLPTADVERIAIAVSEAQPNSVWALIGDSNNQSLLGVYKSTTSGTSFTRVANGASVNLLGWESDPTSATALGQGGQAFYDLEIQVSPTDANEVYVGGVNLYKSTNSGTSWTCTGYWLRGAPGLEYIHADHHALEYDPSGSFYTGCDGGIFKTTDNGSSWTDISNNLGIAQVARIGISSTNKDLILTGMQDNGSNKLASDNWTVIKGGDGCEQIVDPIDNDIIFSSYVQGTIYRSTNGGTSWTTELSAGGGWITPFVMDPADNDIMYSGSYSTTSKKLQKSTNNGQTWSAVGAYNPVATKYPNWISVSKSSHTTLYISSGDMVWKSTNSGGAMSSALGDLSITASISSVEVSPNDKDFVVVTLSGYETGEKVFRTTNGGTNWTNISSNLPNLPVNVVVFEEDNANRRVYIGTDNGIYYKDATNASGNWTLYDSGLPQTSIHDMEIFYGATYCDNRLRAATYGRSVWESDLVGGGTLSVLSREVTQANTATVSLGDVSQEIIGINITMSNCGDPLVITDFNFNTTGTTDAATDIENAKLYYTGAVNNYEPIQQFGTVVANPNGTFTVSGTRNLVGGDNHFWLTYDIKSTATGGNFVDAECTGVTIGGSTVAPSPTTVVGDREIVACSHCSDVTSSSDDDTGITLVDFNTITQASSGVPEYTDYTGVTTSVTQGTGYVLSLNVHTGGNFTVYGKAWIDWDHDCSFEASEEYDLGLKKNTTNGVTSITPTITIPLTALTGNTIMRVRATYNVAPTPCGNQIYSEAEDYTTKVSELLIY